VPSAAGRSTLNTASEAPVGIGRRSVYSAAFAVECELLGEGRAEKSQTVPKAGAQSDTLNVRPVRPSSKGPGVELRDHQASRYKICTGGNSIRLH
jgi:hypothetical protein